jgi:hypothetical protein
MQPFKVYITSALLKDTFAFFLKYDRFPRFYEELGGYVVMTNDLMVFSYLDQYPEKSPQIIAWYEKIFGPWKRCYNHSMPYKDTSIMGGDNTHLNFRSTLYQYLPAICGELCRQTRVNLFADLYQIFDAEFAKRIYKLAGERLVPYWIDLVLCVIRGSGQYLLLSPPWAFDAMSKAQDQFTQKVEFGPHEPSAEFVIHAPNEIFHRLWEGESFQHDVGAYHQLDLLAPQESRDPFSALFPIEKPWTGSSPSHWFAAAFTAPINAFFSKYTNLYGQIFAYPRDRTKFFRSNPDRPVLFLLTPAVLRAMVEYFYLDDYRIPPVLAHLGKYGYLRFAIFREYLSVPGIYPHFWANFHLTFHPLYVPPTAAVEISAMMTAQDQANCVYSDARSRFRSLLYLFKSSMGIPGGIIGTPSEQRRNGALLTLQESLRYVFDYFKLDYAVVAADYSTFAFCAMPPGLRKKDVILVTPIHSIKPLLPGVRTPTQVKRHLGIDSPYFGWSAVYRAAIQNAEEGSRTFTREYLMSIPSEISDALRYAYQAMQNNAQTVTPKGLTASPREVKRTATPEEEYAQWVAWECSRPFIDRLLDLMTECIDGDYPELLLIKTMIRDRFGVFVPTVMTPATPYAVLARIIGVFYFGSVPFRLQLKMFAYCQRDNLDTSRYWSELRHYRFMDHLIRDLRLTVDHTISIRIDPIPKALPAFLAEWARRLAYPPKIIKISHQFLLEYRALHHTLIFSHLGVIMYAIGQCENVPRAAVHFIRTPTDAALVRYYTAHYNLFRSRVPENEIRVVMATKQADEAQFDDLWDSTKDEAEQKAAEIRQKRASIPPDPMEEPPPKSPYLRSESWWEAQKSRRAQARDAQIAFIERRKLDPTKKAELIAQEHDKYRRWVQNLEQHKFEKVKLPTIPTLDPINIDPAPEKIFPAPNLEVAAFIDESLKPLDPTLQPHSLAYERLRGRLLNQIFQRNRQIRDRLPELRQQYTEKELTQVIAEELARWRQERVALFKKYQQAHNYSTHLSDSYFDKVKAAANENIGQILSNDLIKTPLDLATEQFSRLKISCSEPMKQKILNHFQSIYMSYLSGIKFHISIGEELHRQPIETIARIQTEWDNTNQLIDLTSSFIIPYYLSHESLFFPPSLGEIQI